MSTYISKYLIQNMESNHVIDTEVSLPLARCERLIGKKGLWWWVSLNFGWLQPNWKRGMIELVPGTAPVSLDPCEVLTSCFLLMDHNHPLMTWLGMGSHMPGLSELPTVTTTHNHLLGSMKWPRKRSFYSDQRIYLTGWLYIIWHWFYQLLTLFQNCPLSFTHCFY